MSIDSYSQYSCCVTSNPERADPTTLSGTAVQHANDGYSRCGHFGDSFVDSMYPMYSSDGTNGYGSRVREFEGTELVYGLDSCVPGGGTSYSLVKTLLL